MLKAAVFSDTHGDLSRLPAALRLGGMPDTFLHLGDFGSDGDAIASILGVKGYQVRGNCDFSSPYPRERVVTLDGVHLLMLHGDTVAGTYAMACKAEEHSCKAVLFGHTHMPLLTASGPILIINPGSLSKPRGGTDPSFGMLVIDGGEVNVKLYALKSA